MPDYSGDYGTDSPPLADTGAGPALPSPSDEMGTPAARSLSKKEAKRLKDRMERSEAYMCKSFKPLFERCEKLWSGQHFKEHKNPSQDHRVVVNRILPMVETKVATLGFNYPEFLLKALTQLADQNARIATQALRYEWRRASAQREAKRALKDKEMFGVGIVQTGWEFVTDEIAMEDGRQPVEGEPPDEQAMLAAVESGEPPPAPVPRAKVRKDQFYVRRICPKDFRIDPEATWVIEDAAYCGYVEHRPLEEVKADKRYRNTRDLKGTSANLSAFLNEEVTKLADEQQPTDVRRVKLMHYYEKKRRLYACFCDENDKPLYVGTWDWEFDRYPFHGLFSAHSEDAFYPEQPPPILVEPMQREINEARSQLATHRRRYNRAYQCRRGTVDAATKAQIKKAEDGRLVEHTGEAIESIVPIRDAPLQPEVYQSDIKAREDMADISALSQYEAGVVPTKRMTSSETEAIQAQGGARMKEDAQQFERFCAAIAQDCLEWLQQYAAVTRSLPIYDQEEMQSAPGMPPGPVAWPSFTKDEIQGQYLVEVYVGSTQVKSSVDKIKDIGFLLQTLQPFLLPGPAGPPMLDAKPLLQQLLQAIPEIRDVHAILNPAPPLPPPMPGGGSPVPGLSPGGPPPPGLPPGIPPGLMAALANGSGPR